MWLLDKSDCGVLAFCLVLRAVLHDKPCLRDGEGEGDWRHAEYLEAHPEIRALRAPNKLVDCSQHEKENAPTEREFAPALFIELKNAAKHNWQ